MFKVTVHMLRKKRTQACDYAICYNNILSETNTFLQTNCNLLSDIIFIDDAQS